jgi:signal transduction histidine kinase
MKSDYKKVMPLFFLFIFSTSALVVSQDNNHQDPLGKLEDLNRIPDNTMKVDSFIKYINLAYINERTNIDQYTVRTLWIDAFMSASRIKYKKGIYDLMKIFHIAVNQKDFEPFLFPLPYNDFINAKNFKVFFRFRRQIHGGTTDYFKMFYASSNSYNERYLASFQYYLGLYYYDKSSYSMAKKFFNGAISNSEKNKDSSLLSMIYLYSGIVEWEENHLDISMTCFQKSLDISEKIKDSMKISCAFNNIGQIYFRSGSHSKALDCFDRSIRIYPGKNSDSIAQRLQLSKATVCIYLANYGEADGILKSVVNMAKMCRDGNLLVRAYCLQGLLSEKKGDLSDAISKYAKFSHLKDSLLILEIAQFHKIKVLEIQDQLGENISGMNIEKMRNIQSTINLNRSKFFTWSMAGGILIILVIAFLLYLSLKSAKKSRMYLSELNETKNTFLSIISHDLRSPLSGLINMIGPLQRKVDKMSKEELLSYLDNFEELTRNSHLLLNNLLLWSQSQRGVQTIRSEKFNFNDVIDLNVNIYHSIASKRNILLKLCLQDDLEVFADKNMVELVVRNLLDNAIKNSFQDSEILISTTKTDTKTMEFSITDYGKGMIDSEVEYINGSGRFGDQTMKAGLGLKLCMDFIGKHGSKLVIRSNGIGKGCCFSFNLPVYEAN